MPATKQQILIRDQFSIDPAIKWRVDEASEQDSRVDGQYVLARVVGPMFLRDGVSENKRRYQPACWENAFLHCADQMARGGLLGTAGHDQDLDEKALLEGKITHTTSKLWFDGNIGMGEILIFNTPGGQIINNLLRAGVQIAVSSRAYGSYTGEKGPMGEDIIDPETFFLKAFDWVFTPGVNIAYPRVAESKSEIEEKGTMSESELKAMNERLNKEKYELHQTLDEALESNRELRQKTSAMEEDLAKAKKALTGVTAKIGRLAEVDEGMRKWLEIEPLKTVAKETGLASTIVGVMTLAEKYAACGRTPTELEADLKELKEYRALGTKKDIKLLEKCVRSYLKLGKPTELVERLKKYVVSEKKANEKVLKDNAAKIAKTFNESATFVESLLQKMTPEEVIKLLKNRREGANNMKRFTEGGPTQASAKVPENSVTSILKQMR